MKNASGGVIKNSSDDEACNYGNTRSWGKSGSNESASMGRAQKGSGMGNHLTSNKDEAHGMPSKPLGSAKGPID